MKKVLTIIFLSIFFSHHVSAEMNPRVRAMLITSAYGTAGGALLGAASLAFGASGRSVAKGASLGLYAGIGFGAFVIISHKMRQRRLNNPGKGDDNYYPDSESPYEEEESGGLFGLLNEDKKGQDWNAHIELARYREVAVNESQLEVGRTNLDFVLPVLNMTF